MRRKLFIGLYVMLLISIALFCGCNCTNCSKPAEHVHNIVFHEKIEATCVNKGTQEYYECLSCHKLFKDVDGVEEVSDTKYLDINMLAHDYREVHDDTLDGTFDYYECSMCHKTIDQEQIEYNCPSDFVFNVQCDKGKAYIQSNLKIVNEFFETEENISKYSIPFTALYYKDNIYNICANDLYEEGFAYSVIKPDDIVFTDYSVNKLSFIIKSEEKNIVDYKDGIVFLKALETNIGGYYPYNLQEINENLTDYLELTIHKANGINVGDIICIGDAFDKEEMLLSDDIVVAKVESIVFDGSVFRLKLACPELCEIFSDLDIFNNKEIDFNEADIEDYSIIEENAINALCSCQEYYVFLSAVKNSASEFFEQNNYKSEISTYSFLDNISLNPEIDFSWNAVSISIIGRIVLPINTKSDKNIGDLTVQFTATAKAEFNMSVNYKLFSSYDYIDVALEQISDFDFTFSVLLNVDYSLENDDDNYLFAYNKDSAVLHSSYCRHITNIKDKSKIVCLDETDAEHYIENGCSLCKVCNPDEYLISQCLGVVTTTGVVHRISCMHYQNALPSNKIVSSSKIEKLQGTYSCCNVCYPERQTKFTYEELLSYKLSNSDWGESLGEIKEISDACGVSEYSTKAFKIASFPYQYSIITGSLDISLVLNFKFSASLNYNYGIRQQNIYGMRVQRDGIKTYSSHNTELKKNDLEIKGSIGCKIGFQADLNVSICYLNALMRAGITTEVGIYADISGIYKKTAEDTFAAAYFEAGLYYDIDGYYYCFGRTGKRSIVNAKNPFVRLGYETVYYALDKEIKDFIVTDDYSLDRDDYLSVDYYNVKKMKAGTTRLKLEGEENLYSVVVTLRDGSYCSIEDNKVVIKDNAPDGFNDAIIIKYIGVCGWDDYKKGNCLFCIPELVISFTYIKEHVHNYTVTIEQPTCTEYGRTVYKCSCGFTYSESMNPLGHLYDSNDVCIRCGEEKESEGLSFSLNESGQYYILNGKGTCNDTVLRIPAYYNNLPVKEVKKNAFSGDKNLTEIYIPWTVEIINDFAFDGCSSVTKISIPDSVKRIGLSALYCPAVEYNTYDNAYYLGNKPNPYVVLIKVISKDISDCIIHNDCRIIYEHAFECCKLLTEINIPDSVVAIGYRAFSGGDSYAYNGAIYYTYDDMRLENVYFGENLEYIGVNAFCLCVKLQEVILPDSVLEIDEGAFESCKNLSYISFNDNIKRIGVGSFKNCVSIQEITIPDSVLKIEEETFYGCTGLIDLFLGKNLKSIDAYSFGKCSSLGNLIIPDSVEEIGDGAFRGSAENRDFMLYRVKGVNNVIFGNGLKSIGSYAFAYTPLTEIIIPDNVETIMGGAFDYCIYLRTVHIGKGVKEIGTEPFGHLTYYTSTTLHMNFKTIIVEPQNEYYSSESGILYNKDKTVIIRAPELVAGEITLPDGLIEIPSSMFENHINITKITMQEGLQIIGDRAFYNCSSLNVVIVPNSLQIIGEDVFSVCNNLSYNVVGTQRYLGNDNNPYIIFMKETSETTSVCRVQEGCKIIHTMAIWDYNLSSMQHIKEIYIPSSVICVCTDAVHCCYKLSDVYFDGTYESWINIRRWDWMYPTGMSGPSYTMHYSE